MKKSEKLMWLYLLKNGSVYKEWSYYGGRYEKSPVLDGRMRKEIKQFGIDWNKTRSVQDDYEDEFNGTFTGPMQCPTLSGKLFLNNHKNYKVGMNKEDSITVLDIVLDMIDIDLNEKIDEAFKEL